MPQKNDEQIPGQPIFTIAKGGRVTEEYDRAGGHGRAHVLFLHSAEDGRDPDMLLRADRHNTVTGADLRHPRSFITCFSILRFCNPTLDDRRMDILKILILEGLV